MTQYEDIEAHGWNIEFLSSMEIGERAFLFDIDLRDKGAWV